eukprot:TRINITY_DN16215_c0_g1_i4.p1 TRINITY_DN16215_c0_g1~~TRINITY_DN16215_c0_g1_i4.p1  ORF type:complete len:1118 (-),score=154.06 TRINITY_DN16215_c0_g1_i4:32-3385(-)
MAKRLLGTLLAICTSQFTGREIKLGVLTTWKGPVWNVGESLMGVLPAINDISKDASTLPGENVTFLWADTQCSGGQTAFEATLALLRSDVDVVIGSPCSGDTEKIAHASAAWGVPMISFYAVSSALSDKRRYPAFARVIGSMVTYDNVTISFMKHLGWNHSALVYPVDSAFATTWAVSMRDSLEANGFVEDIEIPYSQFGKGQADLLKDSGARIVLWLEYNCEKMRNVLLSALDNDLLDGWAWILDAVSTTCFKAGDRVEESLMSFNGVYSIKPYFDVDQSHYDAMLASWQEFRPYERPCRGTATTQNRCADHMLPNSFADFNYSITEHTSASLVSALLYDAIMLYAKAAHTVLARGRSLRDIPLVMEAVLNTRISGMTGDIKLDANGDRMANAAMYMVTENAQGDGLEEVQVGLFNGMEQTFELLVPEESLVFAGGSKVKPRSHRVKCAAGHFVPEDMYFCAPCPIRTYAPLSAFDRHSCEFCGRGHFLPSSSGMASTGPCIQCHEGTASNSNQSLECLPCTPGSFVAERGSTACTLCPAGSFQHASSQTACNPCGRGKYGDGEGHSACKWCDEGAFTLEEGATSCQTCDGAFRRVLHNECQPLLRILLKYVLVAILLSMAAIEVASSISMSRSRGRLRLSSHALIVDDIRSDGANARVQLTHPHRFRVCSSFQISFAGTGHHSLDSQVFKAQVTDRGGFSLQHLDGSPLDWTFQTSMGAGRVDLPASLLHQGWPMPVVMQAPILVGTVVAFMQFDEVRENEVACALTLAGVILLCKLLHTRFFVLSKSRSLQTALASFLQSPERKGGQVAVTTPGPDRGIKLCKLDDFAQHFAPFTQGRSMYYVEPNISRQLTSKSKVSLADLLGSSRLDWFVSHWWGTLFQDTMRALKRHSACVSLDLNVITHSNRGTLRHKDTQMTTLGTQNWGDVSYWICTFSNNQWRLQEEIPAKPEESSFFKALQGGFCKGVCMVLDESATPLRRSWCLFEFLQTIQLCESKQVENFQGLVFAHSSGVLHYGTASVEVALHLCKCISGIRLEDTHASNPADKELIDACVIAQLKSFEDCNRKLKDNIQKAVTAAQLQAEARFNSLFQQLTEGEHERKTPPPSAVVRMASL